MADTPDAHSSGRGTRRITRDALLFAVQVEIDRHLGDVAVHHRSGRRCIMRFDRLDDRGVVGEDARPDWFPQPRHRFGVGGRLPSDRGQGTAEEAVAGGAGDRIVKGRVPSGEGGGVARLDQGAGRGHGPLDRRQFDRRRPGCRERGRLAFERGPEFDELQKTAAIGNQPGLDEPVDLPPRVFLQIDTLAGDDVDEAG